MRGVYNSAFCVVCDFFHTLTCFLFYCFWDAGILRKVFFENDLVVDSGFFGGKHASLDDVVDAV